MDMVALSAEARQKTDKPQVIRQNGKVPCVMYGSGKPSQLITCDRNALTKVYMKAGESTLVELAVGSNKVPVLFHELDLDPVSGKIAHVDFYMVDMSKEIEAKVPVRFSGEAPAIKELSAIFVAAHDHVTVRCLPKDLPHELVVDVSGMKAFRDVVTVTNLQMPAGIKVKEGPGTVLAVMQEPREEEVIEVAAPVEGAEVAEGEVSTAEGVAPAEGAEGAEASPVAKKEEKKGK